MDAVLTQLADKIWAKFLASPEDKRFCKWFVCFFILVACFPVLETSIFSTKAQCDCPHRLHAPSSLRATVPSDTPALVPNNISDTPTVIGISGIPGSGTPPLLLLSDHP